MASRDYEEFIAALDVRGVLKPPAGARIRQMFMCFGGLSKLCVPADAPGKGGSAR
jgi:hypothetical protein